MKISEDVSNTIEFIKDFGKTAENPEVSVIIVTWNRKDELTDCLNGLKGQTYSKFETIVADNGEYAKANYENRNLKYIKLQKNFRPSFARNICLWYSRAKIVAFLDDDAIPDKRWIENIIYSFKKNMIIALRGKILSKDGINVYNLMAGHYDLGKAIVPSFIDIEGNCAFKKKELLEIDGFDPEFFGFEGIELTNRLIKNKDMSLSIYDPSVIIYHNACDSFIHCQLKNIRHSKNSKILNRQNPKLSKFIRMYLDVRTNYYEDIDINLLISFKWLILKITGLLTGKFGIFLSFFTKSRHK